MFRPRSLCLLLSRLPSEVHPSFLALSYVCMFRLCSSVVSRESLRRSSGEDERRTPRRRAPHFPILFMFLRMYTVHEYGNLRTQQHIINRSIRSKFQVTLWLAMSSYFSFLCFKIFSLNVWSSFPPWCVDVSISAGGAIGGFRFPTSALSLCSREDCEQQ